MSCLLPQFKCSPETFALHFKSQTHSFVHSSRNRDAINLQTHCILTVASAQTSTTVLDFEELQLSQLEDIPTSVADDRSWAISTSKAKAAMLDLEKLRSLNTHPISIAANKPLTYIGSVGHPSEDTLVTNEEAVINAAASEALALAKAAVRVAKDAAMVVSHPKSRKPKSTTTETLGVIETTIVRAAEVDDVEPSVEELEFLEAQLSASIAVRSNRQTERKARRSKAVEKAAADIVSVKSGSSSRKKRSLLQEVDYSDPLRYLRGTTSTSRLLTASEEKVLSEGIQVLMKLERLQVELRQRFGKEPTSAQLAAAAGVDLKTLKQQMNYGVMCKDRMIKSNIRLVISIAKKYQGTGMNLQDLVQEGSRGLVRGAEKFDASKGFKFSTYAHFWIKQAVRKSLSDRSRTIRLPFHMVEAGYRVKEARKQLYSKNGRDPSDEEVAEAAGLSLKRLSAVMLAPKSTRSLDQKVGENLDLKPSEVISDPGAETADELLLKQFMRQDLAKVLESLNPRESQVIRFRFGLEDGRMKTLQEIGELIGVSRERIRQIESSAFRKLKNKKRTNHLQQYAMLQQKLH